VQPEVGPGHRQPRRGAAPVERLDPLAGEGFRLERTPARPRRIIGLEDRERAVADELQHVAPGLVDRGDDRLGVIVQQRDDLLGRRLVGDPRVAP
jgi:hypothetical protein